MSILGSDTPDSPEKKIEEDEQKVVKHLKNLDKRLNQILEDEIALMDALDDRRKEEYVSEQLSNIEIALQNDIEEGESSIVDEIQLLREEEEKFAKKNVENNYVDQKTIEAHERLLELLGNIIPELHDEEQRLQELVQVGNKYIRNANLDHQEAHQKLQEHVKQDQEEAIDLQNKIQEAAKLERKIMEDHG